ncbi:MAG: biopolymer transporter ExbD [Candidatus Latescibacteria bacterium]|jgi:biopolymer transport protein ExbD|nr:biopolymer transporter ExbD [Candidatus Latescibacterota bacterium]
MLIASKAKKKPEDDKDLDITSLMDAMTIVLVFLLKQYGSNVVEIADGYKLPKAETRLEVEEMMQLQVRGVGKGLLTYRIADMPEQTVRRGQDGSYSTFVKAMKEHKKIVDAAMAADEEQRGAINVIGDGSLDYEMLLDVMKSCAVAGFYKIKLIAEPESG